jgi:hypothetical protein
MVRPSGFPGQKKRIALVQFLRRANDHAYPKTNLPAIKLSDTGSRRVPNYYRFTRQIAEDNNLIMMLFVGMF